MIKQNKYFRILFMVFTAMGIGLFFNSCVKNSPSDCLSRAGEDITEERTTGDFNKIILYNNVNLVITQDSLNSVEIKAGEKIIDKVNTRITEQGELIIENNNVCNWMRSFDREIIAYVRIADLKEIEYRGSGDISSSNTIKGDSLKLNIWEGAGKIELDIDMHRNYIYYHIGTADVFYSGFTHISYITAASFGPVDVREMHTVFTYIENKGSNNCYVNAGLHLGATISSIGNIYYLGNPDVSFHDNGSGELKKLE